MKDALIIIAGMILGSIGYRTIGALPTIGIIATLFAISYYMSSK